MYRLRSKIEFRNLRFGALVLLAFLGVACQDGGKLVSLTVTPYQPSIAKGTTQQFTATGNFANGSTQDLTTQVTWTALDTAATAPVATISATGLAVGSGIGQSTISATYMEQTATAVLTVSAPTPVRMNVTPSNSSIAKGTSQQFVAKVTLTDDTIEDVSTKANWSVASSAGSVVTIDQAGLAKGVEVGQANVTATFMGVGMSVNLTVTNAVVTGVNVTPSNPAIAKGTMQQFKAIATFSDATTQDITNTTTWTAADIAPDANVASLTATGLATGTSLGSSTITASFAGKSGTARLTVTAAVLASIAVSPNTFSLAKGTSQQLSAIATFTDATTQDITTTAVWSAMDVAPATNVAAISQAGVATGQNLGGATIMAALGGKNGTATLTVTAALLTTVKVAPATASIAKGTTRQFSATATFTDASTQDVSKTATWTTTDVTGTGVTSVDANGLVTGTNVGTATITATFGGKSDAATLTVTAAVVTSMTIAPKTPSIAKGVTQQFIATAVLSDATTQDVTSLATWSSADVTGTGVASVDAAGRATGTAVGRATITATYLGFTDSASLTVTAAVPMSIVITPNPLNIPRNMVVQLTATLVYSDSTTLDVTTTATWDSATPATATVTATGTTGGRARGVTAGNVIISATAKGVTGQITATVTNCYVTVNEVQVAGAGGASDEWVELYNGCPFAVDLNNARILYRSAAGVSDVVMVSFDATTPIAAGGFLLYVGSSYPAGSPRNGMINGGLAGPGGGLGVVYPLSYTGGASNLIVDSVGYGTATNIYVEGTVIAAPASASSIRRRPNGTDTNDNSVDFTVTTTPTPGVTNG